MLLPLLMLMFAAAENPAPTPAASAKPGPALIDEQALQQLLTVRRVFVDRLSGGDTSVQIRDMIVSSLQNAKLFVITENADRADAVLRGSAEDLVFTEEHSSSESINARANVGTRSSTARTNTRGESAGLGIGESESSRSNERKHEAVAAVRLVNKDGDVIWSTTQESKGGKFLGSSADVADRITKKLAADFERARKVGK
jgi:hypothetical protein